MDPDTDLQNYVQNYLLQAQSNPPPGDLSPAIVPEDGNTSSPPATNTNDIGPNALKKRREMLRALSKTFGNIPGVPIFTHWEKRIDCSNSAVHRSARAGICGTSRHGVYSVALSNSYADDEDGGDVIIYTGTGGRQKWSKSVPPKRISHGSQTEDQSWDMFSNKALIVSYETGNPVRVIRSWRCPSQYAPSEGHRYDGLYKVTAYWTAKGSNGKKICRCRLERLPDQPPIPLRPITLSASRRRRRERLVHYPTCNPSTSTEDVDIRPNQTNTRLAESTASIKHESGEFPGSQQLCAMFGTSTMGEVGLDAGNSQPAPPTPNALRRYMWDSENHMLVRVPVPPPVQEDINAAGGDGGELRGEDDATLVPSEDDHVNECMEVD